MKLFRRNTHLGPVALIIPAVFFLCVLCCLQAAQAEDKQNEEAQFVVAEIDGSKITRGQLDLELESAPRPQTKQESMLKQEKQLEQNPSLKLWTKLDSMSK